MAPESRRTARGAAVIAALLACACFAPGATAQGRRFGENPIPAPGGAWRAIRSPHAQVCFHAGEDSLAWRALDLAEKTHAELVALLGRGLGGRANVILVAARPGDPAGIVPGPAPIEVGADGVRTTMRTRIVLAFDGSYEDLRRALVHRLVHLALAGVAGGRRHGAPPVWFVEGLAEYVALGLDPDAEAVLREAAIEDELPPLGWSAGYLEYKQGQAAVAWMVARRGPHALRDLLDAVARGRDFDRAFTTALGVNPHEFEQRWREHLRRRYWPEVAHRERPEAIARRLVHTWNGDAYRTCPAVSPQGDRVACFADHGPFADVEILSIADGRVRRRVARAPRPWLFERAPSLRRGIAWSPDGRRLAIAGLGSRATIEIVSDQGMVVRRLTLPCASVAYPAWSPNGDSLVVAAVRGGNSDLWLVGVVTGRLTRLTDDAWDEREPSWSPDGHTIAFASDRGAALALEPRRGARGFGGLGIYTVDVATGGVRPLVDTPGDDHAPSWSPDGGRLAFVSDVNGTPDVWLVDRGDTARVRLTHLFGGAQSVSWSRQDDRLVFSAYDHEGFDLFAVREPLSVAGALDRLRRAAAAGDSLGPDSSATRTAADSSARDSAFALPAPGPLGSAFALSAGTLAQRPRGPRGGLRLEEAGLALHEAPDLGFVLGAQSGLRDLLGRRSLYAAADLFAKKPEDSQGFVVYRRLVRRFDLGVGAYRFVNGFAPSPATFGEQITGLRFAPERTYGAFAGAGFALRRTLRIEGSLRQYEVEPESGTGSRRPATSPSLALIADDVVPGGMGPVSGRRWNLTFTGGYPALHDGLDYRTITLDTRRYWNWTRGYVVAGRALLGGSGGSDARTFMAGGFGTLRGRPDWALTGTRAAIGNLELRFPFLERLGILGPVPVGTLNTRGVVFADAGSVWNQDDAPKVMRTVNGHPALEELAFGFGTGIRAALPFTIFKADVAWSTDFNAISRPRWYVSLSPDF